MYIPCSLLIITLCFTCRERRIWSSIKNSQIMMIKIVGISIIKAKLWNVVMKCKNNDFLSFGPFFLEMYISEVVTFFSRLILI